jgi:hypothetical protein
LEVVMRRVVAFSAGVLLSALASAQSSDIPVSNWTVPPYAHSSGGITTMVDATPPRVFIGVQPCRLVDTRSGAFPAGFGPPNLSPGVERVFDLLNGPCPGMPISVAAYSLNITVVTPSGPGHLVIWPTGSTEPTVSSINYTAGQTIANAVIVPAGNSVPIGAVSVKAGVSGTHLLIDINGYFSSQSVSNFTFDVQNNSSSFVTANFFNSSSSCSGACALSATSSTTAAGRAISGNVPGGGDNSAGVFGKHLGGFPVPGYTGAGVRGESNLVGVLGIAGGTSAFRQGVAGSLLNNSAVEVAWGALGSVPGVDPPSTVGPWGVFAGGNIGATGTKSFLDPHPTDPNLSIAYISLEGPEAGTYFRGRGRFQNGMARIAVPEHFRFVTDPEGLTVQVTPIGGMATVGVVRMDLREIVVQSSRNLEFSYLVQGVRSTFKDLQPLRPSGEFRPRNADARIPEWLSPAQKRLLIQNGTYDEEGRVNLETARRLGWDRIWDALERPAPELNPE